ncbi:MAG: MBL fold metallo-hydrolase [Vicinamibacterales bacterium]
MMWPPRAAGACVLALAAVLVFDGRPTAQKADVDGHVATARTAAGDDFRAVFDRLCAPPPAPAPTPPAVSGGAAATAAPARPARDTWHADPVKVFDNLYFVGQTEYSAWAVLTSAGIIVIDPLFDYSVADEVVGGLEALGADPATIKYVIISHGHSDHAGGASFLQDRYKARVVVSAEDWDLMERTKASWKKPRRDVVAADGHQVTLGDTTITLHKTPGHTLGTFSTIIPLRDGTTRHTAAYWGGTAFNWLGNRAGYITAERPDRFWFDQYIGSAQRFRRIAGDANADVLLSNHTAFDGSKSKLPAMARRRPGDPHPYVIGSEAVSRYLTVAEECALAGRARVGG